MAGQPVCVVVGAGPGNGAAFARRFAKAGYRVALLARDTARLDDLAGSLPGSAAIACDVARGDSVARAAAEVRSALGPPDVIVYNAGSGAFGNVDQIAPQVFEEAWRVNALGLLLVTQAFLPDLRRRKAGHIVVIGATASVRGGANFAAFAPAKAAQRSLAQSLARHLGPEGIHVCCVVIDGVIDSPRTRKFFADNKPGDFYLQSDDIAESVFALASQPRSAWTFEMDLRPFGERW